MHSAAPVGQMQRAVARPRRRDLRIGFGRRVERNAHGVIEPFTHGGAAGHTEQPEIILSRHRNRPPLTAGAAARAHFTCKFRHIIRHKVRCFHRHQRTIGGFIPYSNQEPGVLGFPIYGLLCNPCYDELYHPKLNRQNDTLSKKRLFIAGAHISALLHSNASAAQPASYGPVYSVQPSLR